MINAPFDVIFSAYVEQQYIPFGVRYKLIPVKIKGLFWAAIVFLLICLRACYKSYIILFWISVLVLLILNVALDKETKKALKPKPDTFAIYRKNTIAPLRVLLKKYRMYSERSIEYLLERCNQEIAKETTIERVKRILKSYFLFVWKLLCIAGFGVLLKTVGVSSSNTQIGSMFLDFLMYFDTYYALAILIMLSFLSCEAAFMYYEIQVMLEDITSQNRNRIKRFSEDLQFILIDFQNREMQ